MKKIGKMLLFVCLACMLNSIIAKAQTGKIPPFRMVQANRTVFKAEDLPMGRPIVIVYFSTECDHCSRLMKEMLGQTAALKKASVAMITFLPVENVAMFAQQYKLANFPNFYVGTESTSFFVRDYYKIKDMPFMALYTKNGDLVKTYPSEGGLTDLLTRLKNLN